MHFALPQEHWPISLSARLNGQPAQTGLNKRTKRFYVEICRVLSKIYPRFI